MAQGSATTCALSSARASTSPKEMSFDLDPNDPAAAELAVYAYLSWLQEQLVAALTPG